MGLVLIFVVAFWSFCLGFVVCAMTRISAEVVTEVELVNLNEYDKEFLSEVEVKV